MPERTAELIARVEKLLARIEELLAAQGGVNDAVLDIAAASRGLAASVHKDSQKTLEDVKNTVAAGVTAAAEVAAKAAGDPPSGNFPARQSN
jgi:uncharacterized protein YoxC